MDKLVAKKEIEKKIAYYRITAVFLITLMPTLFMKVSVFYKKPVLFIAAVALVFIFSQIMHLKQKLRTEY